MPDEKMKPTEPPPEIARPALAVLFLCALIAASVWILRPFLPALIWATMVVIATWPLMLRVQQRLGKPSAPIWSELILPMIQRFETLAVQLGRIDAAITHDGQAITVVPLSPLQKAQNQDKVMITRSNLEMFATLVGPEAMAQFVDVIGTGQAVAKASGDELLQFHDQPQGAPVAPAAPAQ